MLQQLLVQLKEHLNKKYRMNLDLNLYASEDGFDVYVHSIKLKLPNCHHIYMILFLKVIIITTHET